MSPLRLTRQFDVPRAASDPGRVCAKASEELALEVAGHEVAISYRRGRAALRSKRQHAKPRVPKGSTARPSPSSVKSASLGAIVGLVRLEADAAAHR